MRRLKRIFGFTAVEIAMVATVIAILALLILPLFRKRTAEAKIAAARDEIQSLVKSLAIANYDTNKWFRLQDLDNTQNYNDPPLNPDLEVPVCVWNRRLTTAERQVLHQPDQWLGPYHSVARFVTLGLLRSTTGGRPYLLSSNGGPILYDPTIDKDEDKLPIDPWGSPYIMFGEGSITEYPGYSGSDTTYYGNGVIYSLGPNGVAGDDIAGGTNPTNYQRWGGVLGTGDEGQLGLFMYF
jgi:type II secretory pathway pseudopilin PulG